MNKKISESVLFHIGFYKMNFNKNSLPLPHKLRNILYKMSISEVEVYHFTSTYANWEKG